jgi:tRNA dimethylallyltransferase
MIDIVEPSRVYSAADFARDALAVMRRLRREGRRFFVVGGAGLYLRALFEPFFEAPRPDAKLRQRNSSQSVSDLYARLRKVDPDRAVRLHPNDRQRISRALEVFEQTGQTMTELLRQAGRPSEFLSEYVVLTMPRKELDRRLDERFDAMMRAGLLDEVRGLREAGLGRDAYVVNAYGYAELLDHLAGGLALEQATERAKAKTRAYARRQLAWFRALPGALTVECHSIGEAVAKVEPLLVAALGRLT